MQGFQNNRANYAPRLASGPSLSGGNPLDSIKYAMEGVSGIGTGLDNVRRIGKGEELLKMISGMNAMNYDDNNAMGKAYALAGDSDAQSANAYAAAVPQFAGKAKNDLGAYGKQLDFLKGLATSKGATVKSKAAYDKLLNAKRNPKLKPEISDILTNKELIQNKFHNNQIRKSNNDAYNQYVASNGIPGSGVGSSVGWLDPANDVITNMNKYTSGGGISPLAAITQQVAPQQPGGKQQVSNPIVKKQAGNQINAEDELQKSMLDALTNVTTNGTGDSSISPLVPAGGIAELLRNKKVAPGVITDKSRMLPKKPEGTIVTPQTKDATSGIKPTTEELADNQRKRQAKINEVKHQEAVDAKHAAAQKKYGSGPDGKMTTKGMKQWLKDSPDAAKAWMKSNLTAKNAFKFGKGALKGFVLDYAMKAGWDNIASQDAQNTQQAITGYSNPIEAADEGIWDLITNPKKAWDEFTGNDLKGLQGRHEVGQKKNIDKLVKSVKDGSYVKQLIKDQKDGGKTDKFGIPKDSSGSSVETVSKDGKDFSAFDYEGPRLMQYAESKGTTNANRENLTQVVATSKNPIERQAAMVALNKLNEQDKMGRARNNISANVPKNILGWSPNEAVKRLIPKDQQEAFNKSMNPRSRQILDNILNSKEVRTDGGDYVVSIGDKAIEGENPMYLKGKSRSDLLKKFMMLMSDMSQDPASTYQYIQGQEGDLKTVLPRLINRDTSDSRMGDMWNWAADNMTNDTIPGAGSGSSLWDSMNPFVDFN